MTATFRIVSFGEAMIRLTPPANERLERTISLNLTSGGSELNTVVTAGCLGHQGAWVSALPDTALGRSIVRSARAHAVDTNGVSMLPEVEGRTGLYFLEEGADPRPSSVLYDRANSAMALLKAGHFAWEQLLAGAQAFMVSGITPALGPGARQETLNAIWAANKLRIPVFFDPNYRSKLWTEDEARACFVEIVPYVDVLFASRSGLESFFGVTGSDHGEALSNACERLGLAACVLTRKRGKRSRSQKMAAIGALANRAVFETDWTDVEIVDRVGGGDAFAGGFICGYLEQPENLAHALELGLAASTLKHTMVGDFLCATRSEIEAAMIQGEGGVLQR